MTEVTVSLIDTTEGVDVIGITILPPMLDTVLRLRVLDTIDIVYSYYIVLQNLTQLIAGAIQPYTYSISFDIQIKSLFVGKCFSSLHACMYTIFHITSIILATPIYGFIISYANIDCVFSNAKDNEK